MRKAVITLSLLALIGTVSGAVVAVHTFGCPFTCCDSTPCSVAPESTGCTKPCCETTTPCCTGDDSCTEEDCAVPAAPCCESGKKPN